MRSEIKPGDVRRPPPRESHVGFHKYHLPVFKVIRQVEGVPGAEKWWVRYVDEETERLLYAESVELCPRWPVGHEHWRDAFGYDDEKWRASVSDVAERLVAWVTGLSERELDDVEAALIHCRPALHADFHCARTGKVPCGKCHGAGKWTEWMGSGSIRVGKWHPCAACGGTGEAQPSCVSDEEVKSG